MIRGLKITINLTSPFFMSRFTTIDSILLSLYYGSVYSGINPYEDKGTDFIFKRNGSFSGSIWFIERNAVVMPYTDVLTRLVEDGFFKGIFGRSVFEFGRSKVQKGAGAFRTLMNFYERLASDSVYFYIDADPDKVRELLIKLKNIGKKGKYGWGAVSGFRIEDARPNKGFFLNQYTPSKPLPLRNWKKEVITDRIAYFRPQPPYWLKTGIEPCCMPHTNLIETADKRKAKGNVFLSDKTVVPATLIASCYYPSESQKKKVNIDKEAEGVCAFCGRKLKGGIPLRNSADLSNVTSSSFADFNLLASGANMLCEECFTALKSVGSIFKSGIIHKIGQGEYEKKSPKEAGEMINRLMHNPDLPYLLSWKTTSNQQHTFFKSGCHVSISELMPVVCRGDGLSVYVDRDMLLEAIKDAEDLYGLYMKLTKSKSAPKSLLTTMVIGKTSGMPVLKKETSRNEEYMGKLFVFWRKYDFSTRMMLHFFLEGKRK